MNRTTPVPRSPREKAVYFLSVLIASLPFGVAVFRAFGPASDLRFLWMASASALGAALVIAIMKSRSQTSVPTISVWILVVASALAGSMAYLQGATAAFGIWAVALVFGLCWSVSFGLSVASRPRLH